MNVQEFYFILMNMDICATQIQRIIVKLFNFTKNLDILYAAMQYK